MDRLDRNSESKHSRPWGNMEQWTNVEMNYILGSLIETIHCTCNLKAEALDWMEKLQEQNFYAFLVISPT